ncbi:DUF4408 domain-containing protein [Psidium guajava]|nr:DUF4408 domain-containing protein [Psidium guajava]
MAARFELKRPLPRVELEQPWPTILAGLRPWPPGVELAAAHPWPANPKLELERPWPPSPALLTQPTGSGSTPTTAMDEPTLLVPSRELVVHG